MKNQTLSLLLDGELGTDEIETVLDSLLKDPGLQRSWNTLHILRAAIKDNGVHPSCNLVDKVSASLEEEPTIMAPDNLTPILTKEEGDPKTRQNVVPIFMKRNKVLAYAAIAASFAALVMVSYSPKKNPAPTIADSTLNVPNSMAIEQELQSMIVQHGEFSGAAALNGLVTYAKVVNGSTGGGTR